MRLQLDIFGWNVAEFIISKAIFWQGMSKYFCSFAALIYFVMILRSLAQAGDTEAPCVAVGVW